MIYLPDHHRSTSNGYVREHILIAEAAFGKPLPLGVVIHHHTPKQIVICQDNAYHKLIHQRMKALEGCGHANWHKCKHCKRYDNPVNLTMPKKVRQSAYHKHCAGAYQRERSRKNGRV